MIFISPLKLFSFSRYLGCCLDFLVMQKSSLIRKIGLISKFMTSQPRKQIIRIYILPNISRSKGKQTMKFDQLIEHTMRKIFLKNQSQNVEKLFPFLRNQNWVYLWINTLHFTQFVFNVWQVECSRNILELSWRLLAFTSYKTFLKNKNSFGTSLPATFFT